MIEFPTVSREIRSLIARRQELHTFLGSLFAGLGIFAQNALQGGLPAAFAGVEEHLFAFYGAMLMVPSLILALRMARLHGGMVLNGMLYARLMQGQDFAPKWDVERAAAHNFAGVSFLQFLLADFVAGFSASVMTLALGAPPWLAPTAGAGVALAWLALYFRFHHRAVVVARAKIAAESCEPFTRDDWEAHVSASLHDANHEMIAIIAFVGLIAFSVFEVLSGLGQIKPGHALDLRADQVVRLGPPAYTLLLFVSCLLGLTTYLRIRVAIGRFSLDLDPKDRPFRRFSLTDSLLGYLLLAFFLAVSAHLGLIQLAPRLPIAAVLAIGALILAVAVVAEQLTLAAAERRYGTASRRG